MDFVVKNWTYIEQSANCRALEIAEITRRFCDLDDYRQDIYLWVCKRAPHYNPARGTATTFIAMTTATAKKRILRRLRRQKHRIINDAIPQFDQAILIPDSRYSSNISEFIDRLPEPERSICTAVILNGDTIGDVSRRLRTSYYKVTTVIRRSMMPVAIDLGIVPEGGSAEGTPKMICTPLAVSNFLGAYQKVLPKKPKGNSAPWEVATKLHKLSFSPTKKE